MCKLKLRLREFTSCLCSTIASAVCFEGCLAGPDATETGNEVSQPKFGFTSLLMREYEELKERERDDRGRVGFFIIFILAFPFFSRLESRQRKRQHKAFTPSIQNADVSHATFSLTSCFPCFPHLQSILLQQLLCMMVVRRGIE